MTECPDHWVFVELHELASGKRQKSVFAGWIGGYLTGSSWRLSTQIVEETQTTDPNGKKVLEVLSSAGTKYRLHHTSYGCSIFMCQVLENLVEESVGTVEVTVLPDLRQS